MIFFLSLPEKKLYTKAELRIRDFITSDITVDWQRIQELLPYQDQQQTFIVPLTE